MIAELDLHAVVVLGCVLVRDIVPAAVVVDDSDDVKHGDTVRVRFEDNCHVVGEKVISDCLYDSFHSHDVAVQVEDFHACCVSHDWRRAVCHR